MRPNPIILSIFLCFGCSLSGDSTTAQLGAKNFYSVLSNGGVDAIMPLYSSKMFVESTSKEEWREFLEEIHGRTGPYIRHEVTQVSHMRTIRLGAVIILSLKVTYQYFETQESLTYVGGHDPILAGHSIKLVKKRSADNVEI